MSSQPTPSRAPLGWRRNPALRLGLAAVVLALSPLSMAAPLAAPAASSPAATTPSQSATAAPDTAQAHDAHAHVNAHGHGANAALHGHVIAVRAVEVQEKTRGVGVVAGAVLGGLLGHQFGHGTGNALTTVGGAAAGGYAGNAVERQARRHVSYVTTVKLDDGHTREFHLPHALKVGTRVRVQAKQLKVESGTPA